MSRMPRTESVGDNLCPVCHDPCEIFAFGPCDHPICYRCSTRMRVLCNQMYCPICRGQLQQIVFLTHKQKYDDVDRRNCIPNRKFKILLEDESVEDAFSALLEHHCKFCEKSTDFKTFPELQRHVARIHELFPCKLCVEHLKLFTFERKFYTRKELATHSKKGDPDNTSYRGHPQCDFCNERYMDKDELLRHLRKSHYYCHFCDAHNSNEYFSEYADLKEHFRLKHFLCQEGECGQSITQFTHAFNSEIDLKAHVANEHLGNRSKAQVREIRTIDVNFQVAPRRRGRDTGVVGPEDFDEVNYASRDRRRRRYDNQHEPPFHSDHRAPAVDETPPAPVQRPPAPEDFPTLGNTPAPFVQRPVQSASEEQYPALPAQRQVGSKPAAPLVSKASSSLLASKLSSSVTKSVTHNGPQLPSYGPTDRLYTGASVVSAADSRNESTNLSCPSQAPSVPVRTFVPASGRPLAADDFPSLSNGKTVKTSLDISGAWSKSQKDTSKQPANAEKQSKPRVKSSFVALGRTLCDDSEFPTLGGGAVAQQQSGWVKKNLKEHKHKTNEYTASPDIKESNRAVKHSSVAQNVSNNKLEERKDTNVKNKKKKQNEKIMERKISEEKTEIKDEKKTKAVDGDSGISLSSVANEIDRIVEEKPISVLEMDKKDDFQVLRTCTDNAIHDLKPVTSHFVQPVTSLDLVSTEEKENEDWEKVESKKSGARPFREDDFPTLQVLPKRSAPPPGFQKPNASAPPGLSKPSASLPWGRAPPGLSTSIPSPASTSLLATTTMTSATSSKPSPASLSSHVYLSPPDSAERNRLLVQRVRELLEVKIGGFEKFRTLSGDFRGGQLSATDYYKQCQELFGHEKLLDLLPEFVSLLPDIGKQHELHQAHRSDILGICAPLSLSTCPACQQIMKPDDMLAHMAAHTTAGSIIAPSSFSLPVRS